MQTIMSNTRGLQLLLKTNLDRVLMPGMIVGALTLAAWVVTH